jgi:LCP family protein required for cell wall assembly
MAKRVLLGAVGVVLLSGVATWFLAIGEVNKVVEALNQSRAVDLTGHVLASTSAGAPETLLLVGDDRRPPPKNNPGGFVVPHSNEMLLVRIDPSKPTISMLSIPRELQVTIQPPGGPPVVNRINVAYTIGGIQLMTETIKHVLGISVNHVFVVTFPKFKRAVDEMGCVYLTVDRRYYHVNEPGGEQYFEINLQPGYQRICGKQALEFVANRHEDTSLTRDARDQRFLLEAKAQYGASLFENREKFERILGRAVETDLHGARQVLDLLTLLVQAQGKPVRQAHFQVNLLPAYDTATPQQIHESVESFLNGTAPIRRSSINRAVHATHVHHTASAGLRLSPTPAESIVHARTVAPILPFSLEYPRVASTYAGAAPETLRTYDVRDQRGRLHRSYVVVVNSAPLGEYYDVQGTSWSDPPLLSNPSQVVHIGSRTYGLFYAGEEIRTIAWREGSATYWVQNTLTNSVQPREMLAIAQETQPVIGTVGGEAATASIPRNFSVPARAAAASSLQEKLGAGAAFIALALLAGLSVLLISRRRELAVLREQVAQALALEARQRPLLASASASQPAPALEVPGAGSRRERPGRRRWAIFVAGLLAAVVLAMVAVKLVGGSSSAPTSARSASVPVAVFNASGTPGEAGRLAHILRADHIHVSQVGDINASLGRGVYVLYPHGADAQARRVAGVISMLSPTILPIQPQVQSAIGRRDEIVVIFD